MKRLLRRIGILLAVFIVAGVVFFFRMQSGESKGDTVYTAMEESYLPVVYMDMLGREMNCLHGYVQDMSGARLRGSLTVLPEDRQLGIRISRCQGAVTGIYYEIRTLGQAGLVERTSVEEWTVSDDGVRAVLPIQNLLVKDQEYNMILTVDTENHGAVRYYSRIVWSDQEMIRGMVDLAADFSAKTFRYEDARGLVTYLESNDAGDNSNLGHVDIHSSYSQITWGGLAVEPSGEVLVTLNEMNGIMSQVTLEYLAVRRTDEGQTEFYEVEDNFTMRQGEQRIYMMDFDRRVDQVFMGRREDFSGLRIMLGITDDSQVKAAKSSNGNIRAFVVNGDLWCYNEQEKRAENVFSFRSPSEEGLRPAYQEYDIRILSAEDGGNVDFLVYGYMNRGYHEGCMGVVLYHYNSEEDGLEERFFVPVAESYEELKLNIEELSYLSANSMLYLKIGSGIYGIDLTSNEYMVVAEGLPEGGYAISQNGRKLTWQEGMSVYQSGMIHLLDLETGEKNEIASENGDYLRVLGFVGNDFIYGLARENSRWVVNGRQEELPMYALEILGEDMGVQTRYEKPGYYIAGVSIGDSRIHLRRIVQVSGDTYQAVDEDTIVCNEEIEDDKLAGIGWYVDPERNKVYFAQIGTEIRGTNQVSFSSPEKITYENSEVLNLGSSIAVPGIDFYAYGSGRLLGVTQDFARAVAIAHEEMGTVADAGGQVLWCRVDRPSTGAVADQREAAAKLMKNMGDFAGSRLYSDGILLLDARGCALGQIQYFLGRGYPVLAYGENGGSVVLTGYDQYNVTVYQPDTGESWKMGLNDATNYFASTGNDFICGIFPET